MGKKDDGCSLTFISPMVVNGGVRWVSSFVLDQGRITRHVLNTTWRREVVREGKFQKIYTQQKSKGKIITTEGTGQKIHGGPCVN